MRLICDRETEIRAFIPEEYWSITALLSKHGQKERFEANLITRLRDIADFNSVESTSEGEEQATASSNGSNEQNGAKKEQTEKGRTKISSQPESDAILKDLHDTV